MKLPFSRMPAIEQYPMSVRGKLQCYTTCPLENSIGNNEAFVTFDSSVRARPLLLSLTTSLCDSTGSTVCDLSFQTCVSAWWKPYSDEPRVCVNRAHGRLTVWRLWVAERAAASHTALSVRLPGGAQVTWWKTITIAQRHVHGQTYASFHSFIKKERKKRKPA